MLKKLNKEQNIYEYDDIDYGPDGEVTIVYPDGTKIPLNPDYSPKKE